MAREDYVASLERSLLGICLLDPTRLREAERVIESTDFADPRHERFFAASVELAHRGGDSSALGVGLELKRLGTLEDGDEAALSAIVSGATADPAATKELARRVREESVRRATVATLSSSSEAVGDRSKSLVETLGELRRNISELERAEGVEELPPITAAVEEILAVLDTGVDPGTPTGLPPLDDAIQGGIKPSQMIVLAGGTGSGKTSLATQIALSAADYAKRRGKGWVLVFSMEMSAPELVIRMVSQVVPIRDGYRPPDGFSRRDRDRVREGLEKLKALPIRVEVPRQSTVSAIRGAIERHVGEHGAPALVIVDHIGLMKDPRVKGGRTEEVGSITRNLKELAMQLEVPVLALSQLNREAGKREGQKPQLTDLRESGSVEQDANIVMFVHRPSYSNTNLEERRIQEEQGAQAFVLIAKNRSGPTSEVELVWVGPRYTFGLTEAYMAANPGLVDADALIDHHRAVAPADPVDWAPADPVQPGEQDPDPAEVAAAISEVESAVFDPDEDLFA